jgi:hypothetical protein
MNNEMTFDAFAAEYLKTFRLMCSYTLTEVGSHVYCEKLAEMADAHPEWVEKLENDPTI